MGIQGKAFPFFSGDRILLRNTRKTFNFPWTPLQILFQRHIGAGSEELPSSQSLFVITISKSTHTSTRIICLPSCFNLQGPRSPLWDLTQQLLPVLYFTLARSLRKKKTISKEIWVIPVSSIDSNIRMVIMSPLGQEKNAGINLGLGHSRVAWPTGNTHG